MNRYYVGQAVTLTATFKNAAGAAVDPTVVTLKVRVGTGTTTTYTYGVGGDIVKDDTGVYHATISVTSSGTWHYGWAGTSPGQAAVESSFAVDVSAF